MPLTPYQREYIRSRGGDPDAFEAFIAAHEPRTPTPVPLSRKFNWGFISALVVGILVWGAIITYLFTR